MPLALWPERERRISALRDAEAALAAGSGDAAALAFRRACLLDLLGRTPEATAAYLEFLASWPDHAGALNNLGGLLHRGGHGRAALRCYAEAVERHPGDPVGHINLANLLHESGDTESARGHYEAALPHPAAHQGLGRVLAELGRHDDAARHRALGHGDGVGQASAYRGEAPPIDVLLLVSGNGGNVPTGPLLPDDTFRTVPVWADIVRPGTALPPHDVVFNAIGDPERDPAALEIAEEMLRRGTAGVVNRPAAVRRTGRAENAARLGGLEGVVTPRAADLPRAALAGPDVAALLGARGLAHPLLIRSPGFHTGQHLLRVGSPAELPAALARLPQAGPGEAGLVTVLAFLDARSPDGWWRKYRVMLIDGNLLPLHLAVSADWKVHHVGSGMADRPQHRAEEQAFLTDAQAVLGPRAWAALGRVRDALGLDYAGIDFALLPDGGILCFEANATMVAQPPDPDPRWDYRRAAVAEIHAAVRRMLLRRAGRG